MKAYLDKWLGKWASRKLVVFISATALISFDKIDSADWAYISISYIVIQGLVDAKVIIDKFSK